MRPLLVLLVLPGCLGADVETDPQSPLEPGPEDVVLARDFTFQPADLNISAGDAATWVNRDDVDHWIAAEDARFNSGRLPPEARFSWTFNEAGTYAYRCTIHAGMVGTIHVS